MGPHATDMVILRAPAEKQHRKDDDDDEKESARPKYSERLFVAAANTNHVYSFGIAKGGQLSPLETINVSLTPLQPLGMTPLGAGHRPAEEAPIYRLF